MAKELKFGFEYDWKDTDKGRKKKREDFFEKCNSEKTLIAEGVLKILEPNIKKQGYLTRTERNPDAYNSGPFDLVAGISELDSIQLIGFEIKADTDSYTRLRMQLNRYVRYCDKVFLVVHKKKVPEWLPEMIGVLRVSEDGSITEEKSSYNFERKGFPEVSTGFEWAALKKSHGIKERSEVISEILELAPLIWRRILFNRFFGTVDFENKIYSDFYPFSESELKLITKINVDYQLEELQKRVGAFKIALSAIEGVLEEAKVRKSIPEGQKTLSSK